MSSFKIPTPQQSIGFQFWKLHSAWQKQIAAALTDYRISHTQFVIMASITWYEEQHIQPSQAQLSKLTNIEKMTLSKAVRQLEQAGLVYRRQSELDTRSVSVSLTKQGLIIIPAAIRAVEKIDTDTFGQLNQKERAAFNAALSKIVVEK